MRKFGLIGRSLKHSFSKIYFEEKFKREGLDCSYELFELQDVSGIRGFISRNNLVGLNVTIPYKQDVMPFLDGIDEEAKEIGAVNTIRINKILEGFNTDSRAFGKSLEEFFDVRGKEALILGTGGASRAVAFALKKLGVDYLFVSRKPEVGEIGYADLNREVMASHLIIVNATPLGMFPDTHSYPEIPYELLTREHLLYDLTYNPEETEFLRRGKERGAKTINGLRMLHLQAEYSWQIWNS